MSDYSYGKYDEEYEEKVFWMLVYIMHERDWRSAFKLGTPKVIEMSKRLEKELELEVPEVLAKIHELNVIIINDLFSHID